MPQYLFQLAYTPEKCVGCMACLDACPNRAHHDRGGQHQLDFGQCTTSMHCVPACPYDALRLIGAELSVTAVIGEVLRDADYYRRSGGGLTLSE